MKKYKDTLNLPTTNFPIKLKPQDEMRLLEQWAEENTFVEMGEGRKNTFVLHDGPPYANGDLHHGHLLNKVLKDIVSKYKSLTGHQVDFRPGWDCHGLPIETQVDKKLGPKRHRMSKIELRKKYREYADRFVQVQREQFMRYGVLAEWDNPYLTMSYPYEAQTIRELAKLAEAGLLYKDLKPVFWCPTHRTALADSEIEYQEDHESLAVYVLYKLPNDEYAVVWTTTPWTLPGNFALVAKEGALYTQYNLNGKKIWVASKRLHAVLSDLGVEFDDNCVVRAATSAYFNGLSYETQFEGHTGGTIGFSDHVTVDSGTGFVHIAPAHGEDDFQYGKKNNLPIKSVIDDTGRTNYSVTHMCGMFPSDANNKVAEYLHDAGLLLKAYKYTHKYPYSSRSHKPVIMKTTEQWFVHLDKPYKDGLSLRQRALMAINKVDWIPEHGYNRIKGMLESRPDWCLSRQRTWGVPIVVLYCKNCGKEFVNHEYMNDIADAVELYGSDFWFDDTDPNTETCDCGGTEFNQELDILDVWFDSGVSNAAVLGGNTADLYLEGSDQHRGWFQSTLLAALGCRELTPYQAVLTHGFVVDDKGEKLSKSKGNYVDLVKTINRDGAELWRLWVAMSEFKNDVRLSQAVLDGVKQAQHKIRNTVRFMLSNLYDFNPSTNMRDTYKVDFYVLQEWNKAYDVCMSAYGRYEFHTVVHTILQFCINDLSSFYFDIVKDILYCDSPNTMRRRAVQTTLYYIVEDIIKLMAPIMSFSMEDAWRELPDSNGSVFATELSVVRGVFDNSFVRKYDKIREWRIPMFIELEKARDEKLIGPFYEAFVELTLPPEEMNSGFGPDELATLFQVSRVTLKEGTKLSVRVTRATGPQCQRCWNYSSDVGNHEPNDVCQRCAEALY